MTNTATNTSAIGLAVQLDLPTEFHAMAIGLNPEDGRTQLLERIGERASDVPAAALGGLVNDYVTASRLLEESGVFYAATSLQMLHGELTVATVTLTLATLNCKDLDAAVDSIVEVLAAHPEGRAAKRYELPCGPAAVAVGAAVEIVLPAAEAGTEEDVPVPVASLEAWIPVPAAVDPTQRSAIVLRFSTPSTQHWEEYCPVLVQALQTLRFPGDQGDDSASAPFAPLTTRPDAKPFAGVGPSTDTGAAPAAASTNRITSALG